VPGPTIWPIGFAVGIVCILAGLVVSTPAVAAGVVITVIFGFLWIREATREYRGEPAHAAPIEPTAAAAPAGAAPPAASGEAAMPAMSDAEIERFPRSKFLELSTLGLGAVIGGVVTVPVLGFAVLPAFVGQGYEDVDLGPLDNFPEGQFVISTFMQDPSAGEVSRRTAYIRYNGDVEGQPSFTIISNRCAHLGCPVQPNGLIDEEAGKEVPIQSGGRRTVVSLTPVDPTGFGCPCHGGQYDAEGNRTAGPPVRALDRFEYSIRNGNLHVGKPFSVGAVAGQGAEATMEAYPLTGPGQHVDGIEAWLYPLQPPR
jgi:Rieske Fe-S protein